MKDEYTTCIALLHDVVEDSKFTFQDLKDFGFPNEVIEALKVFTHSKDIPYFQYIENIKSNPLAVIVKTEDLKHNLDVTRIEKLLMKISKE